MRRVQIVCTRLLGCATLQHAAMRVAGQRMHNDRCVKARRLSVCRAGRHRGEDERKRRTMFYQEARLPRGSLPDRFSNVGTFITATGSHCALVSKAADRRLRRRLRRSVRRRNLRSALGPTCRLVRPFAWRASRRRQALQRAANFYDGGTLSSSSLSLESNVA